MNRSAKNKIYFAVFVWLILCFVMFGWIFKRLSASNQLLLDNIMALKIEEATLKAEKESFIAGKNDLERLSAQKIQPENFFSRDITLVNELRRLEQIANDLGITMGLSGISGTLKSASKAKTKAEIFQIPYSIGLNGPLSKVVSFIEYLENLEYITSINKAGVSAADKGNINAGLTATFYLKK